MTTNITRRSVLRGAGLLAGTMATGATFRSARAGQPVKFAGWTFKPETVQDYVTMYNQKYSAEVKYETVPWPQYHPSLETRAFGGDIVDVMYCTHNNRERWFESGMIRGLDDLPGMDELKKKMSPANLDGLRSKDGKAVIGLPYFTSTFILMYNEPMLKQAGFNEPAKSWDELVDQCLKIKKDKLSDTPYLPNWNPTQSGTMPQFMTDCFAEGAQIFDKSNKLIVDQEPAAAKAMERWQKAYKLGLVTPEIFTKPSSTDTHRMMWTGRYAYHTNHSYYLKTIAGEPQNSQLAPKKAKMAMYPGAAGSTYLWTDSYVLSAKTKVLDDSWKLMRFLGGNLNGDWYVQRQWCLISGLDNPYPEMYQDQRVVQSYDQWIDLGLLRKQYDKAKVIAAFKEPWYSEYDTKAVPIVHNMIRGSLTVPKGLKDLTSLQKSLA